MAEPDPTAKDLVLPEDLSQAAVPPEAEEGWQKLCSSRSGPKMRRAVYRAIALHTPWREAARIEGVDHMDAWRTARRHGLTSRSKQSLLDGLSRVASLTLEEIESRLLENPGDIDIKQLAVINGIATDKLAREWEKRGAPTAYTSLLDQLADKLKDGSSVKLELSIQGPDTIDVTPE